METDWRKQRICSTKNCYLTVDSTHLRVTKCPYCRKKANQKYIKQKAILIKKGEEYSHCRTCGVMLYTPDRKFFCSYRCSVGFDLEKHRKKVKLEDELMKDEVYK